MATQVRVAIVTGAAQGIGRAVALRLADDGLDVVVTDISSQSADLNLLVQDITAKKRRCIAVVGDPSQESDVENIIDAAVTNLGGLDVMIANAGMGISNPLISISAKEWDLIQSFNVRSTFLCYKAAAIQMIKQGRGGRIIGASSISAKQGTADWSSYCASKFAVRGLTQSAAAELRPHGITVNTYAPGAVDVPRFHQAQEDAFKKGVPKVSQTDFPLVSPEEIAGLVSYLVRDEAKLITGQSVNINGGVQFD